MSRLTRSISLGCAILGGSPLLLAQSTYIVPNTHPTIQAAINATINGDTVIVTPGTYVENIDVSGKDITIRGLQTGLTVIDGGAAGPTVTYSPGSTRLSVLENLTITNGQASSEGGGIRIEGSSPTIRFCVIRNNGTTTYGAGIGGIPTSTAAVSPRIEGCIIEDNTAGGTGYASGGGIGFTRQHSSPTEQVEIVDCLIRRNSAATRGGGIYLSYGHHAIVDSNRITENTTLGTTGSLDGGAGIFIALNALATITNNRIWQNQSASNAGGIKFFNVSGAQIINNTIVDNAGGGIGGVANTASFGSNVYVDVVNTIVRNGGLNEFAFTGNSNTGPPFANVSYSNVEGGYTGTANVDLPAVLLNAASGNHRLHASSPCRDIGTATVTLPATDFEGDTRVIGGAVDIGADEFDPTAVLHWSDRAEVVLSAPANVTYSVSGGAAHAGHLFYVLFGLSGTEPGVDFAGMHLPLNVDALTPAVSFVAGALDGAGDGQGVFPFTGIALPPALLGLTLSSAAVIIDPTPLIVAFSNDENVQFVR